MMKTFIIWMCCLMVLPVMAQGNKQIKRDNDMKTLTVYFSYTAGNTKRIAEKVYEAVGGDIVRLEPEKPYPTDYNAAVSQGQEEVSRSYKPH